MVFFLCMWLLEMLYKNRIFDDRLVKLVYMFLVYVIVSGKFLFILVIIFKLKLLREF